MPKSWRRDADQVETIARATLSGFLESDLMPPGMQAPALIWAAAFFVAPALCLPAIAMIKYPFIRKYHPAGLEIAFWGDRLVYLLLSAGAMGLISVVLWDTLFPARRDAYVLTPMPIPLGVQMLGRLSGLVLLFAGFTVALNAIPSVAFPVVASGSFLQMPRGVAGHIVSSIAASAFVFFSVTSAQGLVILAFGRRAAARLATLAQAGAVLLFLLSLLFLDPVRIFVVDGLRRGDAATPGLLWFPPAWFLGLYELIAGTPRPLMTSLALRGVAAGTVPFAITVAIYAFGYKRLLARAVEAPPRSARSALVALGSLIVRATFVRRPEEQAICAFVLRAMARSGRHSMLMSIYIGGGLALMATSIIPAVTQFGYQAFDAPGVAMLSPPLVLSVALAVGMRILMTIPVDLPARWIFQTTGLVPRRIDAAVNKAMLLLVVPPVALVAGISAWVLWGPAIAWRHAVFCASLTLILCEVLLLSFKGSPMTRQYVPGRSRFHMWWAFYLTAFTTYCYTLAGLEVHLLRNGGLLTASGIFVGIASAFWLTRKIRLRQVEEVSFEIEVPDQIFQGFNLTETYAAQSVAPTADGASKFPV
jgi:hypothetical protein